MTAQFRESLTYQGELLPMCTEPFGDYLQLIGLVGHHWPFTMPHTALWRGYTGSWEVTDGRLYLVKLDGSLAEGGRATLRTYFPHEHGRVFAHWYSGEVRIEKGERLHYRHMGYQSVYEQNLFLDFKRGILTGERLVTHEYP